MTGPVGSPVPTGRLVAALVVGAAVVALAGGDPRLVAVAVDGAVALVAVVDYLLAPRPGAIGVVRDLPAALVLGRRGRVGWRVVNPTRRRVVVAVADELAPSLGAGTRRFSVAVPAGGARAVTTELVPSRRGRFAPVELTVRVRGPLGLVARQATRRLPAVLRVHPPLRGREEAELRINRARLLEVGLRSAPGRGGGTEFEGLREYLPDDDSRRIDWAATARLASGRAVVRTYRPERNQTVIVLLDCGRLMAGTVAGMARLDHAMDAALMLCAVATRLGDRTGVVAFADRVRAVVPAGRGRAQLERVTDAVYALEPELAESDYRGALVAALSRFRRRALLVLLTDLAPEAMPATLHPALPLVLRDHLVVVGAVADPVVGDWATSVPATAAEAYRKAAAVAALARRREAAAALRARGVTVVDAPPGRLAPLLADAYLRVKATGRL
jgi:uncharacterized protein (DUF58 family)